MKLGAATAIVFGLGGALPMDRMSAPAQDIALTSDVDALNYALTLEHLEYGFYRDGIGNFTFGADPVKFLATAAAIEATGVSAYQGAAPYLIDNGYLLTAALTIHGVEARHAAYLHLIEGTSPFPDAVNPTLTYDEVVAIVTPFIAG